MLSLVERMRPEVAAGGFPRDDSTIHFFTRVNALLEPHMTVLDFGAGRGHLFHHARQDYGHRLAKLQGKVRKVVGVDVDRAIGDHPYLDEYHVMAPGAPVPLPDASVDIVAARWVLEHLPDPARFAAEMQRILKPGGWLCAHTVNRWGYVGIGARAVPNEWHVRALKRLMPSRKDIDVFSVQYRLNSLADIARHFPAEGWENCSYVANFTPKYYANSRMLFAAFAVFQQIVPTGMKTDLLVFLRKK